MKLYGVKRYIRNTAAFLIALILAVGIVPPVEVFANPQNPVRVNHPGGIINNTIATSPAHGPYDFTLHWQWQAGWASVIPAPPNIAIDPGPGVHQPLHFDIEWRNASTSEPFLTTGIVRRVANLPFADRRWDFLGNLPSGSIMSFRVVPWHWHHFVPPVVGAPTPTSIQVRPPEDQIDEVLFLTDINVSLARGALGGIEITWDNPRFMGQQVFSGYNIDFRVAEQNWQTGITVNANTPGVEQLGGGSEWRFEFLHPGLRPGTPYEIRITPLIGAQTIFVAQPVVNIGGVMRSFAHSGREFIGRDFYLEPGLTIRPEGQDFVTLNWAMPDPSTMRVTEIRIWQMVVEPGEDFRPNAQNAELIHTILNRLGVTTSTHMLPRPNTVPTWFIVELIGTTPPVNPVMLPPMFTNVVEFDPTFNDFAAYAPTIRSVEHAGEVENGVITNLTLDITWRAFTRAWFRPLDDHLQDFIGPGGQRRVIDNDLIYYIYITDEIENFNRPMGYTYRLHGQHLLPEQMAVLDIPGATDWFFTDTFAHYTNSLGERRVLTDNRIFYIRIIARRPADTEAHRSQPAYASYFIPPLRPIDLRPPMVPVRIKEVDGRQEITHNSITIQWSLDWFEVYDRSTSTWHDTIGRNQNGDLVFGRRAANQETRLRLWEEFSPLLDRNDVESRIITRLNLTEPERLDLVVRRMQVDPQFYEIHVVEYDIMADAPIVGTAVIDDPFDRYVRFINTRDGTLWQNIQRGTATAGNDNFREFVVTISDNEPGPIRPNTSYIIFFRPVNIVAGDRYPSHYPTYTGGTTVDERPGLEVDPTTPFLRVRREETTDTSITVYWNGSLELNYELFFSELATDYPATPTGTSGGHQIPMSLIRDEAREEGGNVVFTVHGLFPYTMYHFWIRAITPEGRYSVWSNPVSERTLDIIPPEPPTAVRMASNTSLQAYNAEHGTEYRVGEPRQLILEFMRIFADLNNPIPGPPQSGYDVSGGIGRWLDAQGIPSSYLVFFDELVAGRRHYVRVMTILTVTRGDSPTGIVRAYNYRMQLADNEGFLDAIEIILPSADPSFGSPEVVGQMRRAVSPWAGPFYFFPGQDGDEYDGMWDPEQFPLPERDWELIYDRETSTLTFRFRSNQIDATGARDHNVDQRFISRLVQQRVFTYRLDLSTYNNLPVANAVVEMPYSIMRAFDERRIALELTMDNLRVTFVPGALATAEALALADTGPDTTTRLMINSAAATAPALNFGGSYASMPRRVAAEISTPNRTLRFEDFAEPLQLAFTLDGQAMLMDQNIGLYTSTTWTAGWERVPANHSPITGEMMFNTHRSGNFAAIASAAPAMVIPMHPSRDAFLRVNASVAITDMPNFNPNEQVSANAFNNMIAAVANGRPSVAIYGQLNPDDALSLTRAGLIAPNAMVSREEAMAALVTLYERRVGRTIQHCNLSGPADLGGASPANQLAILKAVELGFFTGAARPTETLTMGDFMAMLDIVIMDIGM